VFFGGAVGGGKSDALLMAALQYVEVPGYAAILFRRTFQDLSLPGALIPRSHEWLSRTKAAWDGIEHQWRFPSGARLAFGYLQHVGDEHRYRSAEFQFLGFDEATQFPSERQVRYVFSRLRRTTGLTGIPLRIRLASNPGGLGHDWVNARYVDPKTRSSDVVFLPSWLADNPYLDRVEYLSTLEAALDETTLAQLVGGDWNVRPKGGRFDSRWLAGHIHPRLPKGFEGWRWTYSIDLAATEPKAGEEPDWTVMTLLGLDDEANVWVADEDRFRLDPGDQQDRLLANVDDARLRLPNLSVVMEQEPGASGKIVAAHFEDLFHQHGVPFEAISATGKKEVRAIPWSTAWRKGHVNIVNGPWVEDWLTEHESFPTGAFDDQVDSGAQGYDYLVRGAFVPGAQTIQPSPDRGSTHHLSAAYHARRGGLDMRRRR
jgi:predicted phage terminase large subunit-like protein